MDLDPAPPRSGFLVHLVQSLPGVALGVALQLAQARLWTAEVYGAIWLLALVLLWVRAIVSGAFARRLLVLVTLVAAAFASTGLRAVHFLDQGLDPALEGRDLWVTGLVASLPQRTQSVQRVRFAVEEAHGPKGPLRLPPLLDLAWYADGSELPYATMLPGERWRVWLRVKAPHGARNPHGFDYELWLWEQGVQASAYVRTTQGQTRPQRLQSTWRFPMTWLRDQVRTRIQQRVGDRQLAGLLMALVVGDQAALERSDWDVFRATGTAHLVAISGLHITMLAWLAAWLVRGMWRRSTRCCLWMPAIDAGLVAGMAAAILYAGFAGWGIPAQRTCLMLASVVLLRLMGVRWPWWAMWWLACALVLVWDPWAMLQPGFWLSFVAVGVLFATDLEANNSNTTRVGALFYHVGAALRTQGRITLALAPLCLVLFGQASVVGFLANLVAIPWVSLLLTPLALLGVVWGGFWEAAAFVAAPLLALLQTWASWPWAALALPQAPGWVGAVAVLGGVVLVLPWQPSLRAMGLGLMLPLLLWRPSLPADGTFELLSLDVGQGSAVLVRTAKHALLYDAGPRYSQESDAGHRVLVPLLQALQVRLDTLVLSHQDSDHVGGAAAVLAMQPQAALLSSLPPLHPLQRVGSVRCQAGQRWDWDGVEFSVLHPGPQPEPTATPNAQSCVLRIAGASGVALLTGDIEQAQEAQLLARIDPQVLRADFLLVAHHGSKTSSSAAFLEAVRPPLAMVQAGYRNRFGHPAAEVLQRLKDQGTTVVDSVHCGAHRWQSGQVGVGTCTRQEHEHYWQHRPGPRR